MHTLCYNYNYNIYKLLHISGLTGSSSGNAQLNTTIVRPCHHLQYVEMSQVHQCVTYREGYVHSKWSSLTLSDVRHEDER